MIGGGQGCLLALGGFVVGEEIKSLSSRSWPPVVPWAVERALLWNVTSVLGAKWGFPDAQNEGFGGTGFRWDEGGTVLFFNCLI